MDRLAPVVIEVAFSPNGPQSVPSNSNDFGCRMVADGAAMKTVKTMQTEPMPGPANESPATQPCPPSGLGAMVQS